MFCGEYHINQLFLPKASHLGKIMRFFDLTFIEVNIQG